MVKEKGKNYYKAIVLDINMPIMDGIDACNKIYSFLQEECLISNMKVKRRMSSAGLSSGREMDSIAKKDTFKNLS